MLFGGNSATQGYTDRCRAAAEALGPGVMLWLPSSQPSDARPYRDCVHIVRCPNWAVGEPPADYANRIMPLASQWYGVAPGVILQLGNEPDLESGHHGEQIGAYAAAVRALLPNVKIGNPPLSVEASHMAVADGCDVVLMHSYFERQYPNSAHDAQFGASYRHGLDVAQGRPVYVTEFNVVQTNCPIDWPDRNRQAAAWCDQAEREGVAGVCLFILDGQAEWASFDVGPEAAAEIIALRNPPPPPSPPQEPPMNLWDAICAATPRPHVRAAMLMGAALETGTIVAPWPDQYGGGPGRGPWQIEAGVGGSHYGNISEEDARNPATAARYMVAEYERAAGDIGDADYVSDPATAYAEAAYRAERPATRYPADRVARAYALISPIIGGMTPAAHYQIVRPVDCPVIQGSDGGFSHGGNVVGFFAIDYGCIRGTPCRAAADGTVGVIYRTDYNPISARTGPSLWIDHDNGYSTFSCHMSRIDVATGDRVTQGQVIGLTGDPAIDGGYGDGAHLHWEVWRGGVRVKMEDLEAAGIAGPWGGVPPKEDDTDMKVETSFDSGDLKRLWDGPKTTAQRKAMPFNEGFGIEQAWAAELRAGRPLGFTISGEEPDKASGRVVRYFSNGKITFFPADGSVKIN